MSQSCSEAGCPGLVGRTLEVALPARVVQLEIGSAAPGQLVLRERCRASVPVVRSRTAITSYPVVGQRQVDLCAHRNGGAQTHRAQPGVRRGTGVGFAAAEDARHTDVAAEDIGGPQHMAAQAQRVAGIAKALVGRRQLKLARLVAHANTCGTGRFAVPRHLTETMHQPQVEAIEFTAVLDAVVEPVRAAAGARGPEPDAQLVLTQRSDVDAGVETGQAHAQRINRRDRIGQERGLAPHAEHAPAAAQADPRLAVKVHRGTGGGAVLRIQAGFELGVCTQAASKVFLHAQAPATGVVQAADHGGGNGVAGRELGEPAGPPNRQIDDAVQADAALFLCLHLACNKHAQGGHRHWREEVSAHGRFLDGSGHGQSAFSLVA